MRKRICIAWQRGDCYASTDCSATRALLKLLDSNSVTSDGAVNCLEAFNLYLCGIRLSKLIVRGQSHCRASRLYLLIWQTVLHHAECPLMAELNIAHIAHQFACQTF